MTIGEERRTRADINECPDNEPRTRTRDSPARAQASARDLTVVDGWRYFIHGWTQVISEVFHIPMTPERVELLAELAEPFRSS